uniref:Uncharacterized protein n=1 Tax=Timema genevievae TaxID=629358 RepID=A0A7R9PPX2_TIMGE|nr:unnamed protein product [Timema genevievae]
MEELDACNVTFSDAATEGPSSRVYHEPLFRIPTRVELRTLTHLAKRPAVDIAFQDLSFTVPSAAGKGDGPGGTNQMKDSPSPALDG